MTHISENQLNLYVDKMLSPQEQAAVETHLTDCASCRVELESLQTLFSALDTLQPDPLMVDLTPAVLRDVFTERQRASRRRRLAWGVVGLQGIIIIALFFFGWSMLSRQFVDLIQQIPPTTLRTTLDSLSTQTNLVWGAAVTQWQLWWTEITTDILSLPAGLRPVVNSWPEFPGWDLPIPQFVIIGLGVLLMWLVGNSIIIRTVTTRPTPGRQPKH